MTRGSALAAGVLALALLAGCTAAPPSETPTAPSVVVHWDAVDPPAAPKVERWYPAYTADLIPAPDYGPLVPYPGTSASIPQWGTQQLYGLATWDGVVVTDPVFSQAQMPTYYDFAHNTFRTLPMLLLLLPGEDEAGTPVYRCGLAADDGSWYSGQVYTSHICSSSLGVLMTDEAGDVVMVGPQGEEVFRWSAQNIPLQDFEVSTYYYAVTSISGPYLCWDGGLEGDALQYVDLRTGAVTAQRPADYPQREEIPHGAYLPDGWYQHQGGTLTIHKEDGAVYTLSLPPDVSYFDIQGDRIILTFGDNASCQLVDLQGNVLLTLADYGLHFLDQLCPGTPPLLAYTIYTDDTPYSDTPLDFTTVVLTRDGRPLLTAQNWVYQFGDRLLYATPGAYHIADLEGNDLLRLPRLDG